MFHIKIPRFPSDPVYGQIHYDSIGEEFTYIQGQWVQRYDDKLYRNVKLATLNALEEYEEKKELLKKTATQVMVEDFGEKVEKTHESTKQLVEALEYALRNIDLYTLTNHQHYSVLYKVLQDNKPTL